MKKTKQDLPGKKNKDGRKIIGRSLEDVAIPLAEHLKSMPDGYVNFFTAQ